MNIKHQRYLILTLLFVSVFCGNYLSIGLFESSDFIFGNISVYIIALLFHPLWAGAAGLLSALIVSINCGHFLLVPVFVLEALCLSFAVRRRKNTAPLIFIALYWLLLGLPLSAFFIVKFLNLTATLILLKLEILFLNALFSISFASLILSGSRIQKQNMIRGPRTNSFFNLVSSYLFILVMVVIFIALSIQSSRNIKNEMEYEAEHLQNSSSNLIHEIDQMISESPLNPQDLSDQIRNGDNQESLRVLSSILDHSRINPEHNIALRDSEGRILMPVPDSFSFVTDIAVGAESAEGTVRPLDKDIVVWLPSLTHYRVKGLFDSRLIFTKNIQLSGWTLQVEVTNKELINSQLETICLILFLLSVVSLLIIPVLKLMSLRLVGVLDRLILQSSRNMYGLDETDLEADWPDSNIWDSYRLKEVISHQKKATSLLNRQNLAFSEMNSALMRSEEHLRITLNSIADGVIVSDAEGRLLSINPVASRLSGYIQEEG